MGADSMMSTCVRQCACSSARAPGTVRGSLMKAGERAETMIN